MRPSTAARLIESINEQGLLEPHQQEEAAALAGKFPAPAALADELVKRKWMTAFQARFLLAGKGRELVMGPYLLLDLLGEGAMGQVFKARHQIMNRTVALKVLHKEFLDQPEALQRFRREIQAIAQVTHPNVVIAHDAAQLGTSWMLAMEYVTGQCLAVGREGGGVQRPFRTRTDGWP